MKKALGFLTFLAFSSIAFSQMPACTGGDPDCILCYGDLENFTSSTDLEQGLSNGVYSGYGAHSLTLEQPGNSNPTQHLAVTSCPDGTLNYSNVMTFPLKSPLHPCKSGTFEVDYTNEPDVSGSSTIEQSRIRVYFFENDVATNCANSEFLACGGGGNYDMIEIELTPAMQGNWNNAVGSYQNNTAHTYNYILVEYIAFNNSHPICKTLYMDDFSFCTDPYSESINLTAKQGTFCKAAEVVSTKISLSHNLCMLNMSNVTWSVVSGDFSSIQTIATNYIWVLPNQTTTYQVSVTTPSGAVLTDQITIYVGAHAGVIVPSTTNPPANSSFWLTLTNYNGTSVVWEKSTRLPWGGWTVFTQIAGGPLPATATIYDTYTGVQVKYRAIVRCGGTSAVSGIVTIGTVKKKSLHKEASEISVYPNPAENVLNVVSPDGSGSFDLTQMNGQLIRSGELEGQIQTIDVSTLTSGVYLLVVKTSGGTHIEKFVKK
ncbi:MAG: T9SS type A sorting domain-containing protein [bacterium]|nr:T9SS type A sorting domain-containing protein [bacterium]